jgi:hypothetical protein
VTGQVQSRDRHRWNRVSHGKCTCLTGPRPFVVIARSPTPMLASDASRTERAVCGTVGEPALCAAITLSGRRLRSLTETSGSPKPLARRDAKLFGPPMPCESFARPRSASWTLGKPSRTAGSCRCQRSERRPSTARPPCPAGRSARSPQAATRRARQRSWQSPAGTATGSNALRASNCEQRRPSNPDRLRPALNRRALR